MIAATAKTRSSRDVETTETDRKTRTARKKESRKSPRSNPYLVGAGLGVLSWAAFAVVNQPLGVSTSLSAASGVCLLPFTGWEGLTKMSYWSKTLPKWDYGMLFLIGTAIGALLSSLMSHQFKIERVPSVWADRYGGSAAKRMVFAFLGGVVIMFGARMAGGCTSGHGISGSLQFAVSSWIFFMTMFIAGAIAAALMFRTKTRTQSGGAL